MKLEQGRPKSVVKPAVRHIAAGRVKQQCGIIDNGQTADYKTEYRL